MLTAKIAYNYSIIRFCPHVETGEFANIGIVISSRNNLFFGFRIETKRHARITQFFDSIEPFSFKEAVSDLVDELNRVKRAVTLKHMRGAEFDLGHASLAEDFFRELTRPREGIISYSEVRTILTTDPELELQKLYNYYVEKNFVTLRYRETVLENEMKILFRQLRLDKFYSKKQFDDGVYRASFPFVKERDGKAVKIVKPFSLGQKDPTSIIDHTVKWKTSVERLRRAGLLPEQILFAVEAPDEVGLRYEAYQESIDLLNDINIITVPVSDKEKIAEFAR